MTDIPRGYAAEIVEDFASREEPPTKKQMVELGAVVQKMADSNKVFQIKPEWRDAAIKRIMQIIADPESQPRAILRAGQVLAAFERVNIASRAVDVAAEADPVQINIDARQQADGERVTVQDVADYLAKQRVIDVSPQLARAIEAQGAASDGNGDG